MKAYTRTVPRDLNIPGLQEFAAAIWERQRRIPSQVYKDPLQHIFDEFDTDKDGLLSAREVARALNSRNVNITEKQAQQFIDVVDENSNSMVDRDEFTELIFHMASVDVKKHHLASTECALETPASRKQRHPAPDPV